MAYKAVTSCIKVITQKGQLNNVSIRMDQARLIIRACPF